MHEVDVDGTLWKPAETRQGTIWRATLAGDYNLEAAVSVRVEHQVTLVSVAVLTDSVKRVGMLYLGIERTASDEDALRMLTVPALAIIGAHQADQAEVH